MRRTHTTRLAAGALALTLVVGACSSDDGDEASTDTTPTTEAMADDTMAMDDDMAMDDEAELASATAAAELRAALTAGLQEHVYLTGAVVEAAVHTPEAFEPAAATLDANSVELSEAIASVYGDDAGAAFLELWRTHIGFFVDYTNARAGGDDAAAAAAVDELTAYGQDFGAFLESANPNLPQDAIAANLDEHVATLSAAIDAIVADEPDAFDKLKAAADHMPMTAATLAGGIVTQMPEQFPGDPDSPAAELRAGLTAGLQEHVYLTGLVVYSAANNPEAFEPAAATLDTNSVELSEAIASVYGDDAGAAFLELWRTHIGFFVDYTNARAGGDDAAAAAAVDELTAYGQDFGAFLESANPNLPQDAIAANLDEHVATLTAAIDALLAGDADAYDQLKAASDHMPMTAATLAGGIVTQMPEQFPG